MKNAIIIPGTCDKEEYFSDACPSLSNNHWFPWLQKQLLIKGILTQTPEMPAAYAPVYKKWKKEFERFKVNKDTILVGHSCGGGFLVRWLSENKIKLNKLILVAPWLDPQKTKTKDFFDFTIDSGIQDRADEIHILVADNEDVEGVKESVKIIKKALLKIQIHRLENMGHFTLADMKTHQFPFILKLILEKDK